MPTLDELLSQTKPTQTLDDLLAASPPEQEVGSDLAGRLIDQLHGSLPRSGPLPMATQFGPGAMGARAVPGLPTEQEQSRRRAYKKLTDAGYTPDQLKAIMQTQNILRGPRTGRTTGGLLGAIAATAIGGRFIPGPFDDAGIFAAALGGAGAGVGGVVGEAAQTALEEKRMIGKMEALKAFGVEMGLELGARGAVRVGKLAASPFIKKTVPEAAALVDDFAKFGGQFSPTELDNRFSLRIAEGFSRGSFGAEKLWQEFEEKQGRAVAAYADSIVNSIGDGIAREKPEAIGQIFADGITRPGGRVLNILDDLVDPLYKQVDELAKGSTAGFRQIKTGGRAIRRNARGQYIPTKELQRLRLTPKVSTQSLKTFAKKQFAADARLNKQFLSPVGRAKMQRVLGLKDNISFSDMRMLRSSYLRDVEKMARDVDQSQGIVKQLAAITDNAIFDPKAAQGLNPKALNLLRNTNALYRSGKQGIKTTFSERLAKRLVKNPSSVIREVLPNNNPTAIRLLRESLVEPISGKPSAEGRALWNQLRQGWLADLVEQSTKEGIADPKVFDKAVRKMGAGMKEIFPEPKTRAGVKKIQAMFDVAGKRAPKGFSLWSRSTQAAGVYMMYQGAKDGDFATFTPGAVLAIGPYAFARLMMHPQGPKLLTAGFKMKPGATGLVPNAVRVIKLLRDMDKREARARQTQARTKEMLGRPPIISPGGFRPGFGMRK